MFTVECQTSHSTGRRHLTGYRTSRQPNVAASLAYARYVWEGITRAWRHDTAMRVTLRDEGGRVIKSWEWRRV